MRTSFEGWWFFGKSIEVEDRTDISTFIVLLDERHILVKALVQYVRKWTIFLSYFSWVFDVNGANYVWNYRTIHAQ